MQLLMEQTERTGAIYVVVTHDEDLAKRSCDRMVHMQDGVLFEPEHSVDLILTTYTFHEIEEKPIFLSPKILLIFTLRL